jgi:outer membrane protein
MCKGYNSRSEAFFEDSPGTMKPLSTELTARLAAGLAGTAVVLACLASTAEAQVAAQGKFGFVNTERILRDASPAVRAQKKIEAEFKKRDEELARIAEQLKRMQQELDKNSVTMSDTERRTKEREFGDLNRDFQRKQREFREDLNQRRNEELARVVELANRVIRQIAEQEKFDLIVQDVVYFSPRIDITDKVIKALDTGKPPAK